MKLLFSCVLALAVTSLARAAMDDWPQFRGPGGQGHSAATGLPSNWSEQKNVRWKTPIAGQGWSSPVVFGNQIWLTTAIEDQQSLRAVCVDRQSGRVVHDIEVFRVDDLGRVNAKNSHASPTPVIDGQFVYVHFGAHGTACLSTDGEVLWSCQFTYDQRHGPGSSPVLCNDLLIVTCDGADVQYTAALDRATGEMRWKSVHPGQQAYSTPILIKVNGASQLITSGGENLIAYAAADGRELWRCRHAGHSVVPRPVAGNGLIYFCTGYWTPSLIAVRPDGEGDVTDSNIEFTVRRGVPHNPSPLLVQDRLYLVSDQGVLTCLNATNGEQVWRERLGGAFSASPTLADGKIYLVNEAGDTFVVATGNEYKLLATNTLDGRTLATPAFCGQAIYFRTESHLYRIEEAPNAASKTARRPSAAVSR